MSGDLKAIANMPLTARIEPFRFLLGGAGERREGLLHVRAVLPFLFGVPMIASNIGRMAELVEDGKNGLLFRVGDAADLRSKVEHLARNPSEVRRLAANVPRVKSSVEHAAAIESLYERVLSGKRRG